MRDKFKISPDASSFTEKSEASTLYLKNPFFSERGD
jgi:hypothetical protein